MTGYNPPKEKAERIARLLVRYPGRGITRDRLARQCSLTNLQIGKAQVTQLWPWIERRVSELSEGRLFANRPTYWSKYLCSATEEPLHATISTIQREKNILTRMINDTERGAVLGQLSQFPDLGIALRSSLIKDRREGYIASYRRQEDDLLNLEADMITGVLSMLRIPANARP